MYVCKSSKYFAYVASVSPFLWEKDADGLIVPV